MNTARLKEIRKAKRISIKELCVMAGINRNKITSIEKGKDNVKLNDLTAICKALEIELVFALR